MAKRRRQSKRESHWPTHTDALISNFAQKSCNRSHPYTRTNAHCDKEDDTQTRGMINCQNMLSKAKGTGKKRGKASQQHNKKCVSVCGDVCICICIKLSLRDCGQQDLLSFWAPSTAPPQHSPLVLRCKNSFGLSIWILTVTCWANSTFGWPTNSIIWTIWNDLLLDVAPLREKIVNDFHRFCWKLFVYLPLKMTVVYLSKFFFFVIWISWIILLITFKHFLKVSFLFFTWTVFSVLVTYWF